MEPRITLLLMALAAGGATSSEGSDSTLLGDSANAVGLGAKAIAGHHGIDSVVEPPRPQAEGLDRARRDQTSRVAALPLAPQVSTDSTTGASQGRIGRSGNDWSVFLDLVDVDGEYRLNQRHFGEKANSTNLCCLDLAWTPWHPGTRLAVGASANVGWWRQIVSDGSVLEVSDILFASSVKFEQAGAGPWARLDLGVSTLVVDRITVGVDWGVGGAARVGWRHPWESMALVGGAGWDFRHYVHLDMKDIPAITLFAGVEW